MRRLFIVLIALGATLMTVAQSKSLCIAKNSKTANIIVDEQDWKGVIRAANDLGDDVRKVSGTSAKVLYQRGLISFSSATPNNLCGHYRQE